MPADKAHVSICVCHPWMADRLPQIVFLTIFDVEGWKSTFELSGAQPHEFGHFDPKYVTFFKVQAQGILSPGLERHFLYIA